MKLAIINGHLIDPTNNIDRKADLFVHDELVVAIDHAPDGFNADQTIDASNLIVTPGLIDLRARLREPGQEYKATIASETRAAANAGITTLCTPPDTTPPIDTPAMAEFIQEQANLHNHSFIYPLGALTQKLAGQQLSDMAALADAGCIGITNTMSPVRDSLVMRRAMQYASTFDLTIYLHAQDPWLQGNGCVHEGKVSTRLGLPAIPEAAEIVGVARDLALIETTGVKAHFCGLSSARAIEMIAEAQQQGLPISADTTIHHLHLTEQHIGSFDTQYHSIPPFRTEADRAALRDAVKDGVIQVICSDHQPHEADAKLLPFADSEPGISGLDTLLPLALRLVHDDVLDMNQAIASMTHFPAQITGIDNGQLGVGSQADICLIDPSLEWQFTTETILSQGKNSPYIGQQFRGKAVQTIINGSVI